MYCKNCGKEHDGLFGKGVFCSRQCSNSRKWNSDDNLKKSIAAKNSEKKKIADLKSKEKRFKKICPVCHCCFETLNDSRIYCSRNCYNNDSACEYRSVVLGGYREGSGRSKSGYYKGLYCGSTYELAWLIYQIDHNFPFERFSGVIEDNHIKYIPDFLINNKTIVEIK